MDNPKPSLRCLTPLLALLLSAGAHNTLAQTAQKPSDYTQTQHRLAPASAVKVAPADPAPFLEKIPDRNAFTRMARVHYPGSVYEIPHLLFVIDMNDQDKVYYVNSRRYSLHEDFLRKQKLANYPTRKELNANYLSNQRRFLLGTLSWQNNLQSWTYEFWEGDTITAPMLQKVQQRLSHSFFSPLRLKTNSSRQEQTAIQAGLDPLTQETLIREQPFLPLNTGKTQGRLHLINALDKVGNIQTDDILVLQETPLSLPPVAGIISDRASTTLSHVNLLANGWGIPNAYVRDAAQALRAYDGKWVELDVRPTGYTLREVPRKKPADPPLLKVDKPVLRHIGLPPLTKLTLAHAQDCGNKATHLGLIAQAIRQDRIRGAAPVPDGFCIPFADYAQFMQTPAVAQRIKTAEATPGFALDRQIRQAALLSLQADLERLPMDPDLAQRIQQQWEQQLGAQGVFARSSSNTEDLAGFNGAGLYSSVPNLTNAQDLIRAVKTVWVSVFNLDAYEARQWARIPADRQVMAVLVQKAVAAQSAGVMITLDPFDPGRAASTYIAAKRGLGIRVIEGVKQAEQIIYVKWSDAIQVLNRSEDNIALQLNQQGGVREVSVDPRRAVLSDALVRRLAYVAEQVQTLFKGAEQDIEWAIDQTGQIVILQTQRYVVKVH